MLRTDGDAHGARVFISLSGLRSREMVDLARVAEEVGFSSLWIGGRVLVPSGASGDQAPARPRVASSVRSPRRGLVLGDRWGLVASLLAATTRLYVGSEAYIAPQRHPLATVLAAATVQNASGGRLLFGVGARWMHEECRSRAVDDDTHGERLDEIIDIAQLLWSADSFASHEGKHYRFPPLRSARVETPIPVILGGTSPAALRRVARRGDGWYSRPETSLEEAIDVRVRIERLRDEYGRNDTPFSYHIRVAGPPSRDLLAQYSEAGFTHLGFDRRVILGDAADAVARADRVRRAAEELGLAPAQARSIMHRA